MCNALDVCRSRYYRWLKSPKSKRAKVNEQLVEKIKEIYQSNRNTYGSPRIKTELDKQNIICNKKRLEKLMKINNISPKKKRIFRVTTDSKHSYFVAEDKVKRYFNPLMANEKWVSDITFFYTLEGWFYLCVVIDLFSRKVVGWAMADNLKADITIKALKMAIFNRKPLPGLIFHSDRGGQYASDEFRGLLSAHGIIPSMSRAKNCWDNAVAESFFHTLKSELPAISFVSRKEARITIFDYIEIFYNKKRIHSSIGFLSPVEFEQLYAF
jgi:putative transposase